MIKFSAHRARREERGGVRGVVCSSRVKRVRVRAEGGEKKEEAHLIEEIRKKSRARRRKKDGTVEAAGAS